MILVAAAAGVFGYYVYSSAHNYDEVFHVKSSLVSPSDYSSERGYAYAIDHPSIKRYVYGWVLGRIGVAELNVPDVDYTKSEKWNVDEGRVAPLKVLLALRFTNAVFVLAALLLVFLTALMILRNAWLALLVALPFVASERIAVGVVAYLGADAILMFFLALSLFAFTALVMRDKATSLAGVLILGAVAGLAASTKFNGWLVAVAYVAYLAIVTKGADRLAKPLLAGLVAATVFVALNPVLRAGGIDNILAVISEMLERRRYIWESQYGAAAVSRASLVARYFPYAAFVLPAAAALVALRREKWVLPVAVWSIVIIAGTLVSVNRDFRRYYVPVEMAVFFTGGTAAWALFRAALAKRRAEDRRARPAAAKALAASVIGVAALAAVAALLIKFDYFGPWRRVTVVASSTTASSRESAGSGRQEQSKTEDTIVPLARQFLGPLPQRMVNSIALAAALIVVLVAGRRVLSKGWLAAIALLPFVWTDAAVFSLWAHSASEAYLCLSAAILLYLWIRAWRNEGPLRWKDVLLMAIAGGAATAAAPTGVFLAATTAAFIYLRNPVRSGLFTAAASAAVSAAATALLEGLFWRMGARAPYDFVSGILSGTLSNWTSAYRTEAANFLLPLERYLPYWPLLPLGAAVLYAAGRQTGLGAPALWAGALLAGAIATMPAIAPVSVEANLALSIGAGMPALAMLARGVHVKIAFREEEQPVDV